MRPENFGFFGFIIFALDLWAIISTVGSNATIGRKVLWVLIVVFLPVIGFIAWFFAGPRAGKT
jgi:hypothetical protein